MSNSRFHWYDMVSRPNEAGHVVRYYEIQCRVCGETDLHHASGLTEDQLRKWFIRRGWDIGKRCNKHYCVDCAAPSKLPLTLPLKPFLSSRLRTRDKFSKKLQALPGKIATEFKPTPPAPPAPIVSDIQVIAVTVPKEPKHKKPPPPVRSMPVNPPVPMQRFVPRVTIPTKPAEVPKPTWRAIAEVRERELAAVKAELEALRQQALTPAPQPVLPDVTVAAPPPTLPPVVSMPKLSIVRESEPDDEDADSDPDTADWWRDMMRQRKTRK
jgi:hypothetical protein